MSIKTMIRVWDQSQHRGSELLTLLALADWSSDSGLLIYKYGNAKIAQRIRGSERTAKRHLRALRKSGELYAPVRPGRRVTVKFITVGLGADDITAVLVDTFELPAAIAKTEATRIMALRKGDNIDTFPVVIKVSILSPFDEEKVTELTPTSDNIDTLKVTELTPTSDNIDTLKVTELTPYPTSYPSKDPGTDPAGDPDPPARAARAFVSTKLDPDNAVDARTMAIAEVCDLDLRIPRHREQCDRAAAQLFQYQASDIMSRYAPQHYVDHGYNGWYWYAHDWRGQKDEAPTPRAIVDTITRKPPAAPQSANGNSSAADVYAAALGGSST